MKENNVQYTYKHCGAKENALQEQNKVLKYTEGIPMVKKTKGYPLFYIGKQLTSNKIYDILKKYRIGG